MNNTGSGLILVIHLKKRFINGIGGVPMRSLVKDLTR